MGQHVILVNPPSLEGFSNERTYSGGIGVSRKLKPLEHESPILPPLDVLYAAAMAERSGARVTIVDLLLDRLHGVPAENLCLKALAPQTDETIWIGVRLSIPSLQQDLDFANRLKILVPTAMVFVFGAVIMATLEHWIGACKVDFLLYGEPEAILGGVLLANSYCEAPGVICPEEYSALTGDDLYDGAMNKERHTQWVKADNLSGLPRPAWHLLDMARYASDGDVTKVGVYVQASRGCPIGCTMCPYALLEGKPWRSNDIETVVDEIEWLNKTYGIYHVRFRDPNFGFNRKYARELSEALIRRGVRLEATVETSVEVLDEETLKTMYAAGIRTITTGIETNDADCMASIGQKISVNSKLRERIEFCHKVGFHIYGTYCLGVPEENWSTVRKTWKFANELDVESGFTVMTPFPGTAMYWRALEEGLLPKRMQYSEWNSYTSTMKTMYMSTKDLDVARLWSRLETIIPYRRKRIGTQGIAGLIRFYIKHMPHYVTRAYCRAYVLVRTLQAKGAPKQPEANASLES